jgi:hypothetical protein
MAFCTAPGTVRMPRGARTPSPEECGRHEGGAVSARPARVSSSSLVSRPCTKRPSASRSPARGRRGLPGAGHGLPLLGSSVLPSPAPPPSTMQVSAARLLPRSHPAATPRSTVGCRLDRVFGRSGGIGAPGRGAPDQEARFRLLQLPHFGLFAAMMVAAQRAVVTRTSGPRCLARGGLY